MTHFIRWQDLLQGFTFFRHRDIKKRRFALNNKKGVTAMDSSCTRMSAINHLHKIYTVEGQDGEIGSVFFEFQECKYPDDKYNRMIYFFRDISKSPDLYPDDRIPKEAKAGFCYGLKVRKGDESVKSLQDLIKKVEGWVTGSLKFNYPVQVTSIDPSMLAPNPSKMPAKNYDKTYGDGTLQSVAPLHFRDPFYVNRWNPGQKWQKEFL
jgi:hypothetical protein